MIELLSAALITASPASAPADVDAYAMGRGAFLAGFCANLGWSSSEERVTQAAANWLDRQADADLPAIADDIRRGNEAGQAEVKAVLDAYVSTLDAATLKTALKTQCDGAASATPELLSRTAETDRLFEAEFAEFTGNGG